MKEIYVHTHLGLGDHITTNGLIWSLIKDRGYDKVYVFCKEMYQDNVKRLYSHTDQVEVIPFKWQGVVSTGKEEQDLVRSLVPEGKELMVVGHDPQNNGRSGLWTPGLGFVEGSIACDQGFYALAEVDFSKRWDYFQFERDEAEEQRVYDKLNPDDEDYIFVHDDAARGFEITVDTPYKIIKNDMSENLFNFGKLVENAKEFHAMESSFRCYSETLDTEGVELFYYQSLRPYVTKISTRKQWNYR